MVDRPQTPRLDEATNYDRGLSHAIIRPRCGEAVVTKPILRGPPSGKLPDLERSRAEADRRAATSVRRLVCEHSLTRMWTLTLAEATTAEQRGLVVARLQAFVRRCRARWPRLQWLAVLEWHPGGHGWHVHMVVNRFVPKHLVTSLWGWGHVDTRRISVKGNSTSMEATRKAGTYVAKYLTKRPGDDSPDHEHGDHRYYRPRGMKWTEIRAEGEWADMITVVWSYWGRPPTWVWWSGSDQEWRGPSCVVLRV
jgi:hypothetical protein